MNHLAKYLTMKIIPREYENDLDQIELAIYGMEGLLCSLSTLFVAIILSFIFHTTYEFVFSLFFIYQIVIGTIIITKTIQYTQYTSEKHPKKNNNPHTRIIIPNIKLGCFS